MKSDEALAIMTDEERSREFFRHMARHLVALTARYQTYDNGNPHHEGIFAKSGFVIRVRDYHIWITAGHCLKEMLDDLITTGTMSIADSRFADGFGSEAKYQDFLPYPYEPGCSFAVDDNNKGLDFGGIPLGHLTLQNLFANGIVPIGKETWEYEPNTEFEIYKMLGIPSHLIQQKIDSAGHIHVQLRPVMITVEKIDPSIANEPVPDGWFVGRVDSSAKIDSIEGMSGGPIYGFRRTPAGRWTYRVVALQSSWWPDTRIIKGCSLPYFAGRIERWIDEINKEGTGTN